MRQLRERGIYKTPDGREHVACAGIFGNYLLYRLAASVEGFPAYVVDVAGRIVAATQPRRPLHAHETVGHSVDLDLLGMAVALLSGPAKPRSSPSVSPEEVFMCHK